MNSLRNLFLRTARQPIIQPVRTKPSPIDIPEILERIFYFTDDFTLRRTAVLVCRQWCYINVNRFSRTVYYNYSIGQEKPELVVARLTGASRLYCYLIGDDVVRGENVHQCGLRYQIMLLDIILICFIFMSVWRTRSSIHRILFPFVFLYFSSVGPIEAKLWGSHQQQPGRISETIGETGPDPSAQTQTSHLYLFATQRNSHRLSSLHQRLPRCIPLPAYPDQHYSSYPIIREPVLQL